MLTVALVTGASRGIGESIAHNFALQGISVAVKDRQKHVFVRCNVSNSLETANAVKIVEERLGTVQILVNAAGISRNKLLLQATDEDVQEILSTNLVGPMIMTKAVLRGMIKIKSGRIINIGSIVGTTGNAGQSIYSASKSGLVGFTKSIAKEMASRGITANVIAPGFISTHMTEVLPEERKQAIKAQIPLGTFGRVEDVAQAAVFLVNSPYITGQVIAVDGGLSM